MAALAVKLLKGEEIAEPVDLGVDGYGALLFKEGSDKVFEGQGWVIINAENVDSFGF
jgi:simple sugar transport system substrate-binding protein